MRKVRERAKVLARVAMEELAPAELPTFDLYADVILSDLASTRRSDDRRITAREMPGNGGLEITQVLLNIAFGVLSAVMYDSIRVIIRRWWRREKNETSSVIVWHDALEKLRKLQMDESRKLIKGKATKEQVESSLRALELALRKLGDIKSSAGKRPIN